MLYHCIAYWTEYLQHKSIEKEVFECVEQGPYFVFALLRGSRAAEEKMLLI